MAGKAGKRVYFYILAGKAGKTLPFDAGQAGKAGISNFILFRNMKCQFRVLIEGCLRQF